MSDGSSSAEPIIGGIIMIAAGLFFALWEPFGDYYLSLKFTDLKILSIPTLGYLFLILGALSLIGALIGSKSGKEEEQKKKELADKYIK